MSDTNTMIDLCEKCGLYKPSTLTCPDCNIVMERNVTGMSLSWKCKNCNFNMVTTIKRFCMIYDVDLNSGQFSKINSCPYARR